MKTYIDKLYNSYLGKNLDNLGVKDRIKYNNLKVYYSYENDLIKNYSQNKAKINNSKIYANNVLNNNKMKNLKNANLYLNYLGLKNNDKALKDITNNIESLSNYEITKNNSYYNTEIKENENNYQKNIDDLYSKYRQSIELKPYMKKLDESKVAKFNADTSEYIYQNKRYKLGEQCMQRVMETTEFMLQMRKNGFDTIYDIDIPNGMILEGEQIKKNQYTYYIYVNGQWYKALESD